ncbi:MAG TPA: ATP-dependent zinc metalloprotease FtsH [Patescibacteria group bacterium]|nr:ATP-dependent zinc metalloprotease FtsH [Patescibacteria group bacterium]
MEDKGDKKKEDRGTPPPKNWTPPGMKPGPQRPSRSMALWIMVLILFFLAFLLFNSGKEREWSITYSQFIDEMENGNIAGIKIKGLEVHGKLIEEIIIPTGGEGTAITTFKVILPAEDKDLPQKIWETNPEAKIEAEMPGSSLWVKALATALPLIALLVLWVFLMRQMQAGGNKAFSFGKSKAKMMGGNKPRVTFNDVAGADEAKEELEEIIEFLKDPKRFQKLGGRIPKGVILLGPPGTGKTLLARAVAGEASVPFFSMSGSDFVEMFVGVGASRVRDLFEKGKKHAPCILFIDELDAVGRHRGAGLGGGHDEREQTLNQLLVEMDGFETNEGVILLAATNRPDVLDPALLRPGRFDRRIVVDMPDIKGRIGIFKVHTRKIPLDKDVDLEVLARGTPGFSGADIANMVNEAALLAARRNKINVSMEEFEEAKDKVLLGPARKSRVMKEDTRRMTAYHEAGHAVVGSYLDNADPLHKVTIIPRGRAGGATSFLPEDDDRYYYMSRDYLLDVVTMSLGGRVAEELVLKRIGTGAQTDIKHITDLVRKMVTQWGMSEKLGPIAYGDHDEQIFLGRELATRKDYSEQTAVNIDNEVRRIILECHEKATHILTEHIDQLHTVAHTLLEREVLDGEEINILLNGGTLPPLRKQYHQKKKSRKKEMEESDRESVPLETPDGEPDELEDIVEAPPVETIRNTPPESTPDGTRTARAGGNIGTGGNGGVEEKRTDGDASV